MLVSLFNIVILYFAFAAVLCIILPHFGFCVLLMTFPFDVERNSNKIEKKIKSNIKKNGQLTMDAVVEIEKDIRQIIKFHGDSKQLSKTQFHSFM